MKISKLLLSFLLFVAYTVLLESCLWASPRRNAIDIQLVNDSLAPVPKLNKNAQALVNGNPNSISSKKTARRSNRVNSRTAIDKNKLQNTKHNTISQDSLIKLLDSIAWNETIHTFDGGVPTGPPAAFRFIFTNFSNHTVKVKGVEAACSCTATDFSRTEIQPGDTGWIQTAYKTQNTFGYFKKYVDVFFEGSPNKHRLYLTGSVDPYRK